MDKLYNEREALKDYIEWIKDERRRLAEEYWNVLSRLRELDEKLENDLRSSPEIFDKLLGMIESQKETVDKLSNIIPKVPVETAVEHLKQSVTTTYNEEIVSIKQIEEEKDREDFLNPRRRNNDIKTLTYEVAGFLKENGVPTRTREIKEYLESKGVRIGNAAQTMNQIMEYDSRIERISKGYYQYRF